MSVMRILYTRLPLCASHRNSSTRLRIVVSLWDGVENQRPSFHSSFSVLSLNLFTVKLNPEIQTKSPSLKMFAQFYFTTFYLAQRFPSCHQKDKYFFLSAHGIFSIW